MLTMLAILAISVIAVVITVGNALKPLEKLTNAALDLADGKVENEIKVASADEVGKLADALERLRVSLQAAMDRLRKKKS